MALDLPSLPDKDVPPLTIRETCCKTSHDAIYIRPLQGLSVLKTFRMAPIRPTVRYDLVLPFLYAVHLRLSSSVVYGTADHISHRPRLPTATVVALNISSMLPTAIWRRS